MVNMVVTLPAGKLQHLLRAGCYHYSTKTGGAVKGQFDDLFDQFFYGK